jgi:hypothetical protein
MKQSKTYSRMDAPTLQLHLPLLVSGCGGLGSLSFEPCPILLVELMQVICKQKWLILAVY